MSITKNLTTSYVGFFSRCADFAIFPYSWTIHAFMQESIDRGDPTEIICDFVLGLGTCIFLSKVVPILPALTSISLVTAGLAACIGLASTLITYPLAWLADAVTPAENFYDIHDHSFNSSTCPASSFY